MKISLKNKSSLIFGTILVVAFFLLHYYVYLGNISGGDIPLLSSYTDSPVEIEKLVFCEQESKKPTYFNPFRKVEYRYQVDEGDTSSECNVIERAESIFTSKMRPIAGDPKDYVAESNLPPHSFMRPQIGYDYANLVFFIIQYSILATFIFILLKPEKSK